MSETMKTNTEVIDGYIKDILDKLEEKEMTYSEFIVELYSEGYGALYTNDFYTFIRNLVVDTPKNSNFYYEVLKVLSKTCLYVPVEYSFMLGLRRYLRCAPGNATTLVTMEFDNVYYNNQKETPGSLYSTNVTNDDIKFIIERIIKIFFLYKEAEKEEE